MTKKVVRRAFLTLRVSKNEKDIIEKLASLSGKDVSAFIRDRLLNASEVSV